jgi:hypothetical protein
VPAFVLSYPVPFSYQACDEADRRNSLALGCFARPSFALIKEKKEGKKSNFGKLAQNPLTSHRWVCYILSCVGTKDANHETDLRGWGRGKEAGGVFTNFKRFPKIGPKTLDKFPKVCDNNKALFARVVFPEPRE